MALSLVWAFASIYMGSSIIQRQFNDDDLLRPMNTNLMPDNKGNTVISSTRRQDYNDEKMNNLEALALQAAPIGSLGPRGTNRRHARYYDSLFYAALQYGRGAKSSIGASFFTQNNIFLFSSCHFFYTSFSNYLSN